ncbi:MAG: 50S ribosomal protein L5 [Candidatus Goldiibacteriota bacterium]
MGSRLKERYDKEIVQELMKAKGYKNKHQVPRLEKIVINMGVGEAAQNIKVLDEAVAELAAVTGQKPVVTRSKGAISNFKLRENMPIGCKVTLRGQKMYEFFDRFVSIALPRVRDFNGTPKNAFDGRGNYTMGIKEQIIFPEVDYDKVQHTLGMDITFVTTAKTNEEAYSLLENMGMPFRKK